ncbi:hypothetical protein F895_02724 [Acinetobacter sp. CIP 64.2]|nr:hypothetical protein F895_02724 [Acinetobacter sp. CIP 64.2]
MITALSTNSPYFDSSAIQASIEECALLHDVLFL